MIPVINEVFGEGFTVFASFLYIFNEGRFRVYNEDKEKIAGLQEEYEYIKNQLEALVRRKEIDEYTKCTLVDMLRKVLEHIAKNYKNVIEGVEAVMVGRVLEYEAKTIKREGIREGIKEGRNRGRLELLVSLVQDDLLSVKDASLRANLTEEEFRKKLEEFSA